MSSNETENIDMNKKRSPRDNHNQMSHLTIISKSIGKIVTNTKNEHFKSEMGKQLNVKFGRRKKNIQTETMKLLKTNYLWI